MKRHSTLRSLLAALAILFSPGLLGSWLMTEHACQPMVMGTGTGMGGAMDASMPGMDMGGRHGAPGGDHRQHGAETCHCIGSCSTIALPSAAGVSLAQVATLRLSGTGFHGVPSFHSLYRPYQLPPALAPPTTI